MGLGQQRAGAARERGVALVMVLWVLVLLGALAVSYAQTVRSEARMARNQVERAQAEALAEAGIARALYALARDTGPDAPAQDGSVSEFELGGWTVRWSLRNAAGLVDINAASPALLGRLLEAVEPEEDAREAMLDAIQDWRDTDKLRRLRGAEDADYRAAGREHGAGDGPFVDVAELQQVLGVTPAAFARLQPHLVAQGGGAGVNPLYASAALLRALRVAPEPEIEAYVSLRADDPVLAAARPPGGLETREFLSGGESGFVRVTGEARSPGGVRFVLDALVSRAPGEGELFPVVSWRERTWEEERDEERGS